MGMPSLEVDDSAMGTRALTHDTPSDEGASEADENNEQ